MQVHKSVRPPSFIEESSHVVVLFIGNLSLDFIFNGLNLVWIFVHVLWMKVPELLKLVIAILIDIDSVLSLLNRHDITAIFDSGLGLLYFYTSTQKRERLLKLPESVPDVD